MMSKCVICGREDKSMRGICNCCNDEIDHIEEDV